MIIEDKATLTHKRVELIKNLAGALPPEERIRIQGELSDINAKIKLLNTTRATQLKTAADQRKITGLAEARANAARAGAKVSGGAASREDSGDKDEDEDENDDPGQTAAVDGWIDTVLLRHDVDFTRSGDGKLSLDIPPKWAGVLEVLVAGIYAAARGQELPELPSKAPRAPRPKKR